MKSDGSLEPGWGPWLMYRSAFLPPSALFCFPFPATAPCLLLPFTCGGNWIMLGRRRPVFCCDPPASAGAWA